MQLVRLSIVPILHKKTTPVSTRHYCSSELVNIQFNILNYELGCTRVSRFGEKWEECDLGLKEFGRSSRVVREVFWDLEMLGFEMKLI